MKTVAAFFIAFLCFFGSPASYAQPQVNIGVSMGEEGLRSFYFSIQEYFRVPEKEVVIIRERRIPDEEIPVILFIAQRARVAPAAIVDLRLGGKSWMDITLRFGLSPEIYYVPGKGKGES
ncbi:MAG: hypothetical protein QME90_04880 [Thermodesulfobacteriota bacterium]|nr:hypothetical protein [Thermodesulfobacteriota bacterium]